MMKSNASRFLSLRQKMTSYGSARGSHINRTVTISGYNPTPQPAQARVGEYVVAFPLRDNYFGNLQDASDCGQKLAARMPTIRDLANPIDTVRSDRDTRTNQLRASKAAEIEPFNQQLQELNTERRKLQ